MEIQTAQLTIDEDSPVYHPASSFNIRLTTTHSCPAFVVVVIRYLFVRTKRKTTG